VAAKRQPKCFFLEQKSLPTCLVRQLWLEPAVLFSCKITHSVITYLDRRGEDLEVLNEKCDWPTEFLRDPSSWLEADKMENLLRTIDTEYGPDPQTDESLMVSAGHQCKDLRAWGVLDSVLRMVQTPKDLFAQPERFLSYFVSPAPPVGEMRRASDNVSFVLPVSEVQFPLVTSYLRAALEALPTYITKPMASVAWDNSHVTISWSESQASLFGEGQENDVSLHPELVRNILHNLETSQKHLEELKCSLVTKDQEIEALRVQLAKPRKGVVSAAAPLAQNNFNARIGEVLHEIYRLGDYVARGQQLITLLIGQGRQTPQVQEAMRRVDWDRVAVDGPQMVRNAVAQLQALQENQKVIESFSADVSLHAASAASPGPIQKSFDSFAPHV
jgi:hypothetical protein